MVFGRGVLHLSVLIETMRREGFELTVGNPQVLVKEIDGKKCEPYENLVVDVPAEFSGKVIDLVTQRKGEMTIMESKGEMQHLEFEIPSRGLIGLRSTMLTGTAGEAVMAHRLLQQYLDGGKSANEDVFEDKCNHSSNMENLATKAERDSIKYMQIRFMEDHKNEDFIGVISGVTDWGIYVEIISNKCEGMVSVRDMKDDHYVFDEDHYALIGKNSKIMYQLGDEVIVKVKNTDLVKKHLDFTLIGKHEL
mgnify:CR=1 FL=1